MDDLTRLRQELAAVQEKIARLEDQCTGDERYLDDVSRSFPLGRVGGSGKAVRSLNRRRAHALDATIDRAVAIVPLYKQRDRLEAAIAQIELGRPTGKSADTERSSPSYASSPRNPVRRPGRHRRQSSRHRCPQISPLHHNRQRSPLVHRGSGRLAHGALPRASRRDRSGTDPVFRLTLPLSVESS